MKLTNESINDNINEIYHQLTGALDQLKQSLASNDWLFTLSTEMTEKVNTGHYYLVNYHENAWDFIFINHDNAKENFYLEELNTLLSEKTMHGKANIFDDDLNKINDILVSHQRLRIVQTWREKVDSIYTTLDKSNITNKNEIAMKSLQMLCENAKEILICFDKDYSPDLANVIDICFARHRKKNTKLVLLNLDSTFLQYLFNNSDDDSLPHPTKLSFLHHWSDDAEDYKYEFFINIIKLFAEFMPKIELIVLRGCSTAGVPKKLDLFVPKVYKVLGNKKNIDKEDVKNNELLFQQIIINNEIVTKVKYIDVNNQTINKELKDIPHNKNSTRLSDEIEKELTLIAKVNNLALLALPSQNKHINKIRADWLTNKAISEQDKKRIKATKIANKTFTVKQLPENELADRVKTTLYNEGINVSVKGYSSMYITNPKAGNMTTQGHGHGGLPKALIQLKK